MIWIIRSSVRFLVSSSGSRSTVFLGFATSGISNQQTSVILEQQFLDLTLLSLVHIFLIVSDNTLWQSLSDGIDLSNVSSTSNTNADVKILESLETEEKDGLKDLNSEGLRLEKFDGWTVNSEDSLACFDSCDSHCVFLSSEALNNLGFVGHVVRNNIDYFIKNTQKRILALIIPLSLTLKGQQGLKIRQLNECLFL